jgi:hypothetical protein
MRTATLKIREIAKNANGELTPLTDIDPPATRAVIRGARTRALALHLLRLRPKTLSGSDFGPITDYGEERGLLSLFTGVDDDQRGYGIGNRILADRRDISAIRRALQDPGYVFCAGFLESHAISAEALKAVRAADSAGFIRIRSAQITALERSFLEDQGVLRKVSTLES